jgi:Flp pilus assembly protein TadG
MGIGSVPRTAERADPPGGKPSASSGRKAVGLPQGPARLPKATVLPRRIVSNGTRLVARVVCFSGKPVRRKPVRQLRRHPCGMRRHNCRADPTGRSYLSVPRFTRNIMKRSNRKSWKNRRGIIAVLSAVMFIIMLALVAFAVDVGYMGMVKTQLQTAADAAALAAAGCSNMSADGLTKVAQGFAQYHTVAGRKVVLNTSDVQFGSWDTTAGTFSALPSGQMGNAIKVTVKVDPNHGGSAGLFFGRVLGVNSVTQQASAVAISNPRDIVFVVDLSGSMNDDTDPNNTASINTSYPGVGTSMMQNFFTDFGFGTYSGSSTASQKIGAPLGGTTTSITWLAGTSTSPLRYSRKSAIQSTYNYAVPSQYLIYVTGDGSGKATDTSTNATKKAYSWVIDEQLGGKSGQAAVPGLMKAAKPALDSTITDNYNYWQQYISNNGSALGYVSYVKAFETCGRDVKPFSNSTLYSPLSVHSPDCPYHSESTDGGTFNFLPREMPTHCARRAIISALQVIKDRNQSVTDTSGQDRVAIVTFELKTHVVVAHDLDNNYDAAMLACTTLQACSDSASCTATETGLMQAITLLNTKGRSNSNKVVVLITDGKPNLYSSSGSTITTYASNHPNSNFYGGSSNYPQDAAIMQASIMQGSNWMFFPIEIGLQGDAAFMNRIYSMGKGDNGTTETSPYSATGDPTAYETELKQIFEKIISATKVRLAQ